jgi:biopolymer transport protein TolR
MAGMTPSSSGARKRAAISEINVTPMVDVMLVLLIIFMVTAPLIQQGVDVNLPKTQSEGLTSDEERLVVTVKRDGKIFVQRAEVGLGDLESKMRTIFETRGNKEVFLRADTKVDYGKVAKTLSALRRAGATRVGMVTEPDV